MTSAQTRSRRMLVSMAALAAVLLAAALWAAGTSLSGCASDGAVAGAPTEGAKASVAQSPPQSGTRSLIPAEVTRITDGDTIRVRMPDGSEERVRLIGMDTPEVTTKHEVFGSEATEYTREAVEGRTVLLELDAEQRDRYGRLLAYVWLEAPTDASTAQMRAKMLNARLLYDGWAQLATYPPNVAHVEAFRELQTEAREAGRGLWGPPAHP